jgi:regulatory protein
MDEPETTEPTDKPTPRMLSWAKNSTIWRLERRMMTEKQLFDAIRRKAREKFEGISDGQVRALADHAVNFALDNKAIDDVAYAEIATRSGMRSGRSRRAIGQRLAQKGVDRDTVTLAVAEGDDLYAAVILARKRAFGPFRKETVELDEKRKGKEISAFARGGFGFELAMKIFAMDRDEADEILVSRRV